MRFAIVSHDGEWLLETDDFEEAYSKFRKLRREGVTCSLMCTVIFQ